MLHSILISFPELVTLAFVSFLTSYGINKFILKSNNNRFSFFYIPADKSPTNARLLGGLSILVSSLLAMTLFYQMNKLEFTISEKIILKTSFIAALIIGLAGYIDDKIEVRARYKLLAQITSISIISLYQISFDSVENILFTIASFIVGMALVNGTNLLDGLDSMSTKLGVITQLAFLILAMHSKNYILLASSLIMISGLIGFYFFGKEPAKIYLGEIGGAYLGLIAFAQFHLVLINSNLSENSTDFKSISLASLIISFPIIELAISFVRRIVMKKSPFRGDKLHLHYILKSRYHLSPSTTSNILSISMVFFLMMGASFIEFLPTFSAYPLFLFCISLSYCAFCFHDWKKMMIKNSMTNIFLYFEDKPVYVIDSDLFKKINLKINSAKLQEKKSKSAA